MKKIAGGLLGVVCLAAAASDAAPISFKNIENGVWSTGIAPVPVTLTPSSGGTLSAQVDSHYQLVKIPAGCGGVSCQETNTAGDLFGPDAYVVLGPNGTYPLDGTWVVPDSASSSWIGPRADQRNPSVGEFTYDHAEVFGTDSDFYVYRMTFNLTAAGLDHATAAIHLAWLSDNEANSTKTQFSHIRMCAISAPTDPVCPASATVPNSQNLGQFAPALTPVDITTGFVPGLMALDFVVYNESSVGLAHNASGLNVLINSATSGSLPLVNVTLAGTGAGTVTSDVAGISCPADCSQGYLAGTQVTLTATANAGSAFTGWLGGGCEVANPVCTVTVGTTDIGVTATFGAPGTVPTLDVDASGDPSKYDALTDGILVMRYLFGLTGPQLTTNAVAPGASRSTPAAVGAYLEDIRPYLDADGNGQADALTDGLLIIRKLFGLSGASMTNGAIGPGATRNAAEIDTFLQGLMP